MIGRTIICCLLFSLSVAAQEQDSTLTFMDRLHQVQQYLDDKAKSKVDPGYIEVPDKPWRVILRYKENMVLVDYDHSIDFPATNERAEWKLRFEPPIASSVGFWVGYRGTGFSYSKSLTKNAGRYYSFSSTGAKYGFNFRLRRFQTQDAQFSATDYKDGQLSEEPYDTAFSMPSPVWIRSVYLNGYYVFNGRRYSQAAAYNQSVIQRRSAGSLLLGATWYQSSFDYSDIANGYFMIFAGGIYRIKEHQANLGVGYGYNWVPFRGLVVNAMAMPTISVYNRVKVYKNDFNYYLAPEEPIDDYGEWDMETKLWANGKPDKPLTMLKEGDNDIYYWDDSSETSYSALQLNLDLRLGIAYNWSNYFIGIQAQYNNFIYKKNQSKVNIFDAYARISLGVRL
ncbi:MAG: DUF4421 family protein [Prevotella sp.]|nr:DUF4421 family protein [Prevotella sp.]